MNRLLLAWFFAVWGVGGGHFYVVGPFDFEKDCNEIHDTMKKDTIGLNSFSRCWSRG